MYFTTNEWILILKNKEITQDYDLDVLYAMYYFKNHECNTQELANALGKKSFRHLNSWSGRFGKRIELNFNLNLNHRNDGSKIYWEIHSTGRKSGNYFIWTLRDEIVAALNILYLSYIAHPEEFTNDSGKKYIEGTQRNILINKYERDKNARKKCIEKFGLACQVCNFNFESFYGAIGKDFIHVHHKIPITAIGHTYEIDPINDLIPVCSNCHAMLHQRNPPYTIDELKEIISKSQTTKTMK